MDEARKQRAIEAVAKYRETLTSSERIAAFAVWFAEQEFGWKDARKEPPIDMMLCTADVVQMANVGMTEG